MKPNRSIFGFLLALLGLVALAPIAAAQETAPPTDDEPELVEFDTAKVRRIAVPALVAPNAADTPAGNSATLGRQIAEVISANLRNSGLFEPQGPAGIRPITLEEVTAPQYDYWKGRNVEQLVEGFVRVGGDGNLTVGCYLYDVNFGQELTRLGFVVPPREWRRAAHKCADAIYSKLTGELPFFDSRIAYIAETGPKGKRVKRLAIMDSDGANHRFITNGQSTALTPRFSPNYKSILYLSYQDGNPRIYVYDIDSGRQRLITESKQPDLRPALVARWSSNDPLFDGGCRQYRYLQGVSASGWRPRQADRRAPGIDVGGSFSPDGSQIVFESDRVGQPAGLCHERRRIEPAPHQPWRRPLCDARMEPARRPDRLYAHRSATCASAVMNVPMVRIERYAYRQLAG
jgi:TolB protein